MQKKELWNLQEREDSERVDPGHIMTCPQQSRSLSAPQLLATWPSQDMAASSKPAEESLLLPKTGLI